MKQIKITKKREIKNKGILLLLSILLLLNLYCPSLMAQETDGDSPNPEKINLFWSDTVSGFRVFLENTMERTGRPLISFLKNSTSNIQNYWVFYMRPWIFTQWESLINYMEKEIRIK